MTSREIIHALEAAAQQDRRKITRHLAQKGYGLFAKLTTEQIEDLPNHLQLGIRVYLDWEYDDTRQQCGDIVTWIYGVDQDNNVYVSRTWDEITDDILLELKSSLGSEDITSARIVCVDEGEDSEDSEVEYLPDEDIEIPAEFDSDSPADQLDAIADNIDDLQTAVEGIDEDIVNIDIDNNLANKLIAECDMCKGVFISATMYADPIPDSIQGECPLCGRETTQYLKWRIVRLGDSV